MDNYNITRLAITIIIAVMVVSSPVFMLVNPVQVSAATTTGNSNRVDSSNYHSTPYISETPSSLPSSSSTTPSTMAPTTLSQYGSEGDFTAQAALSGVWARQTNNIVGAQSYYDIVFVTSTTGTIKFIDITFPAGTLIGAPPRLVEREGIGHGNAVKESSTKISYTVLSPVSIPEGTKIRLEFFNLVNPTLPSTGYKVTVTTKDAGGAIIDGPTASNGFSMKQIGTGQLDPTIFISRFLLDNANGNSFGWNPNGVETDFIIFDEAVKGPNAVLINVADADSNSQCEALGSLTGFFTIRCNTAPPQGSELRYTVTNVPVS